MRLTKTHRSESKLAKTERIFFGIAAQIMRRFDDHARQLSGSARRGKTIPRAVGLVATTARGVGGTG